MSSHSATSEETLLAALKCGDGKAYECLYKKCRPIIVSFIRTNNGSQEDAVDLLQEAMLVLFRNLQKPNFVLDCKVTTFLYSVCRHQWLYRLRKQKLTLVDICECTEVIKEENHHTTDLLTDRRLHQAIGSLDEVSQQLLNYFYYENLSMEEIAQRLHLGNANRVKVRKFRCLQRIRQLAQPLRSW